ncbi:MAG: hypothetical protein OSB62_06195 [Alphaproteobacteria bacterium]|nr:hypothetical protein [Alphaproteobacteria bacterium]
MKPKLSIDPNKINPEKAMASQPQPKAAKSVGVYEKGLGDGGFKVPKFPMEFDLSEATKTAYKRAVHYMNDMLGEQDMQVDMTLEDNVFDSKGNVVDKATGSTVNSYEGLQILKLYAQNIRERGIIVDGDV